MPLYIGLINILIKKYVSREKGRRGLQRIEEVVKGEENALTTIVQENGILSGI